MKKNAFTLIELLAVIVILAIIALIAVPVLLNIINDTKENSLKRSVELYMNSVKTSITKESMNSNFPKGEITCTILNEKSEGTEYDKDDLICIEDDNENISSYVKIDIKGETPINGIIKLNNGKIIEDKTWLEMSNNIFYRYENNAIIKLTEDEINYLTPRLPKEYQEVEYIESTGTQYIDTGLYPNNTMVIEVDTVSKSEYSIFGGAGVGSSRYNLTGNASRSFRYGSTNYNNSGYSYTERSKIVFGREVYLNGNLIHTFPESNFTGDYKLILFGRFNNSNSLNDSGDTTIYYLKIWDNNVLVRNFVPCYSKTTVIDVDGIERPKGIVGMYDLVECKFYTNQGTGEFIKGPDV